jgi:hypothetical protein
VVATPVPDSISSGAVLDDVADPGGWNTERRVMEGRLLEGCPPRFQRPPRLRRRVGADGPPAGTPPSQVVDNFPAKLVRHENRLRHRTPIDCRARRAYILVGHSEADYLLHAFDWGFSVRAGRPHTILKNRMRGALYGALQVRTLRTGEHPIFSQMCGKGTCRWLSLPTSV